MEGGVRLNHDEALEIKSGRKMPKDEAAVIAKIDAFNDPFRSLGRRLHEVILSVEPVLNPRVWYGMPGYAVSPNTPVLLFFRNDGDRMTLGMTEKVRVAAEPDSNHQLMPCAWFFRELDPPTEEVIRGIVRRALD